MHLIPFPSRGHEARVNAFRTSPRRWRRDLDPKYLATTLTRARQPRMRSLVSAVQPTTRMEAFAVGEQTTQSMRFAMGSLPARFPARVIRNIWPSRLWGHTVTESGPSPCIPGRHYA